MAPSCSTDINAPIGKVVALFDNTDNLGKWQDGFQSYTRISGAPGTPGAKAKIIFRNGRHVIELIETIKTNNLPAEMSALYEHKHMTNVTRNTFTELPGNKTRFTMTVEGSKGIGFLPKLMMSLTPGMYKKRVQKWLDNFKAFAEAEVSKT